MAATITSASAPASPAPDAQPSRSARVPVGKLVSAACALLLAIDLFATEWYGVAGVVDPSAARPAVSTAENGWEGLTVVRWVVVATVVAALGALILHVSQREHGSKTETGRLIAALGALTSLLLVYRVLITLPAPAMVIDQKLGAVVGVALALGIAVGGLESVSEQRARAQTPARSRRRETEASDG